MWGEWKILEQDNPDYNFSFSVFQFQNDSEKIWGRWEPSSNIRLRWEQNGYLYEIQASNQQYLNTENSFSVEDMRQIAASMIISEIADSTINLNDQSFTFTFIHSVQLNDTCIGLAQRYGSSVDAIANANKF